MNRLDNGDLILAPINDPRLTPELSRVRSGADQVFTLHDKKDWRNDKEICTLHGVSQSHYAQLVNGVWHWVEGCDKCNGRTDRYACKRCVEHDVCVSCHVLMAKASTSENGAVWGHVGGWQCNDCHEKDRRAQLALAEVAIIERTQFGDTECYGEDKPTCPWCGHSYETDDSDYNACDDVRECDNCERTYKLTACHEVTFNSERVE